MSAPDSWRRKIRNKDEFSKTLDALYDGTLIDSVKEGLWVVWQKILGNDVDEEFNDTTVDFIDKISAEYKKRNNLFSILKDGIVRSIVGGPSIVFIDFMRQENIYQKWKQEM